MTRIAALALAALALTAPAAAARSFTEHRVPFEGHTLYVRDYPGRGPALVLLHGFPDNLHLYDRLIPYLNGRHVVTFDFLGWGRSDKPHGHTYTFAEQERELAKVVDALRLGDRVVPVAHDASGPAAINWALDHPGRTAGLVLLNTFYNAMPELVAPEAIRIFSQPEFTDLADGVNADPHVNSWLYHWQVGRFMTDPAVRRHMLTVLWRDFPSEVPAFRSLNRDLIPALTADTQRVAELQAFTRPVTIAFGEHDPYLNARVARAFHALIPDSRLALLPGRHYVQVDVPEQVARVVLGAAGS